MEGKKAEENKGMLINDEELGDVSGGTGINRPMKGKRCPSCGGSFYEHPPWIRSKFPKQVQICEYCPNCNLWIGLDEEGLYAEDPPCKF